MLRDRILDVATEQFFSHGYGLTSIEAVARRAGISKRTFYHRFTGKSALFEAVVHRIIERMRPPPDVPLLDGSTVEEKLRRLAGLILRAALSPPAIALHRLVIAESARFPELARTASGRSASHEAIALISALLAAEISNANLDAQAREYAAAQFLELIVSIPRRRALGLEPPMSAAELDRWCDDAVELLLHGCSGWRCEPEESRIKKDAARAG